MVSPFSDNPFLGFLEEEPKAAFFSFQDQFGPQGGNQRRFFQDQFANIHNEFLGNLGSQIRQGELPTLKITDFLENFNFDERFRSTAPSSRGSFQSRFNPRTRHLLNF